MHNSVRGAAVFTAVGLLAASVPGLDGSIARGALMDATHMVIDFEDDASGAPILAGQMFDDEYADWGLIISAQNLSRANVDHAIAFDTNHITGGETDLVTPGYGPNNNTSLGMVIIVPPNLTDSTGDGYVDDPEDEGRRPAGVIDFFFDMPLFAGNITILDIQSLEDTTIEFFYSNGEGPGPVHTIVVPFLADNGVQTLEWDDFLFDHVRINVGGSGAFDALTVFFDQPLPEPTTAALLGVGLALLCHTPRRRTG